ncbi:MAG: hypothetical protein ACFFCQ_01680 [Promethearchaeota archaeon]
MVLFELGNLKFNFQEIFEAILAFLHCFSRSPYSKRQRKEKLEIYSGTEKKKRQTKALMEFIDDQMDSKNDK